MKNTPLHQTGGSNLTGIAQYNERLILQLIRRAGSLPKAEIARMTNLSAQTASVIINRLIEQQLLHKQKPLKAAGKVGQPAIPIALNPEGALSLGVKIGRRSLDVILINFVGDILDQITHTYPYPDPDFIFPQISAALHLLRKRLPASHRKRLLGIGIASPYGLGGWQLEADIPDHITQSWNRTDIKKTVQEDHPELPVWLVNDATAACIAALEFDSPPRLNNYLYIFVGTFIGGGIIMNRTLYNGSFNNAGALGSMPLPRHYADPGHTGQPLPDGHTDGNTVQLINCASLYLMYRRLVALGANPDRALEAFGAAGKSGIPDAHQHIMDAWMAQAAPAIAYAIVSAISVIDFEGVVIDSLMPANMTARLTAEVEQAISSLDLEGLSLPRLYAGRIGSKARALGGAFLPFYTHFAPDRSILVSGENHVFHAF